MIPGKRKLTIGLLTLITLSVMGWRCNDKKGATPPPPPPSTPVDVAFYLTKPDKSVLFTAQENSVSVAINNNLPLIEIDPATTFQTMDGFGFALTGGSAMHLYNMSAARRHALLTELFDYNDNNIGISYLRISIGASDLDASVFSYDDLPSGETDVNMAHFSLAPDRQYLIPVLKEILTINPNIKILGSPWSAPLWMKTNNNSVGGSLKPEYYDAYAKYFVKYIQGMAQEGITIDAITVQNEPLHDGNNPSMYMPAPEQAAFIKTSLGPAFKAAGINTKIIIYDHNCDRTDYPAEIYNDADASQYVDGAAFHLYAGSINSLAALHNSYPDKNLYFTEQWIGAPGDFPNDLRWHTRELIIGASRNWCKTVLEWNLAADSNLQPHTDGGCSQCLGALTIDGDKVTRNPAYYIIAHASRFVRPGSVRISTNQPDNLPNVAFRTPDGSIVLIVLNDASVTQAFNMKPGDETVTSTLGGGAVGTYVW
ncbi:glycoside hydrolase family 30 beta sandwich domain-containing protein [Prolixibacter sp. SD074]|jgi:glucosylceramidase|uniref:glycoside hydrolase family 30 protein n=1 Tax=Prolixibacter sp. SD074 TaxID=2652391 RepID=UPI00127CFF92|nr:glycoside hydrolase family 30 beta sandwich domain-containing protein [Prolixibacter sp. SD074]GET28010.1 glucosylceramidase [Prolixibacter sp. SD074]